MEKKDSVCFQAGFAAAPTRAISSIKNMNIPQQIKVTDNINPTKLIMLLGHQAARPATGNQGPENVIADTVTHPKTPRVWKNITVIMSLPWPDQDQHVTLS